MSICWGCVVSASSFVSVMGLGQITSFVANARRARAMRDVELQTPQMTETLQETEAPQETEAFPALAR